MRAVNVPIKVIADFDVLRDEQPLRRIVEGLGGVCSAAESDWAVVKARLDSDTKAPTAEFVRERLMELLNSVETTNLQKKHAERIRQIARSDSGWDRAKRAGRSAVPSGDAADGLEKLLTTLRLIGLFVVEVGEPERDSPLRCPAMLDKIAQFYESEIDATVKALTSIIEPLMIVVVGAIVGAIIIAMYLPMFEIFRLIE